MKKRELADEEDSALVAILRDWNRSGETFRAIGLSLGYLERTASQTIGNVARTTAKGHVGLELAGKIYQRLGTSRAAFLDSRGLSHLLPKEDRAGTSFAEPLIVPERIDRVLRLAGELKLSAADARSAVQKIAAYKGEVTDAQIVDLLRGNAPSPRGSIVADAGGGAIDDFRPAKEESRRPEAKHSQMRPISKRKRARSG